jgi:hypothetical protein
MRQRFYTPPNTLNTQKMRYKRGSLVNKVDVDTNGHATLVELSSLFQLSMAIEH